MAAVVSPVTAPVEAVKGTEIAPPGTVTAPGTDNCGELLPITTLAPPDTAWVRDTVQTVESAADSAVASQAKLEIVPGARAIKTVFVELPNEAVSEAVCAVRSGARAVTGKVTVVEPPGTTMLAGAFRPEAAEIATVIPPEGAGASRAIVQLAEAPAARVLGVQLRELMLTGTTEIRPPDTVMDTASPVGDAPRLFERVRVASPAALAARAIVTAAMGPSGMVAVFNP